MLIKDLHYDFKKKINKIDSQQNRNLLIPEIDWTLNEAKELYIKSKINQVLPNTVGIGVNLRDIRTLVKEDIQVSLNNTTCILPEDYFYFLKGEVEISKGSCTGKKTRITIRQHDDEFETSIFDKSNFEWRVVNGTFYDGGIKLYTDGTFQIDTCYLSYIRKSEYMHNAEDFEAGSYSLPSGTLLENTQECDLPEHTHREIVDLAVLIATGELQIPDYEIKLNKLKLNI